MMSQAQLLQCPDCGHRHDLAALGDVHTFRCEQCGRALKVPAQFRNGAEPAPPRVSDPPPQVIDDTMVQPAVRRPVDEPVVEESPAAPAPAAVSRTRSRAGRTRVPLYWRLLIWLVAIPIGLVLVFQVIARKAGWLSSNQLIDTFTAGGWDRFRPIAQLLPLAAFVIAVLVTAGVYGVERLYRRRDQQHAAAAATQRAVRPTGS